MNIHLFAINQLSSARLSSALLAYSSAESWVDRWVSTRSPTPVMDDDVDEVALTRMSHTSHYHLIDGRQDDKNANPSKALIILE